MLPYRLRKKFYLTFTLDSIFNNYLLTLYTNLLMVAGNKYTVEKIIYAFTYYIIFFLRYRPVISIIQQLLFSLYTPFIFSGKRLKLLQARQIPTLLNFKLSLKCSFIFFISLLKTASILGTKVCLLFSILIQQSNLFIFRGLIYSKYRNQTVGNLILYRKYVNYRW